MKLSVSVMMHPTRSEFVTYFTDRLGPVQVVMDRGLGIWDTCKRAWATVPSDSDYHLVLQDDAVLCHDFLSLAHKAIDGHLATSLYWGTRKELTAEAAQGLKAGCITRRYLHWGLAVALDARLIGPMLAFGEAADLPDNADDTRIKNFLLAQGIMVHYPMPSLVDHRLIESLVTGETNPIRRAAYFLGE